MTYSKRCIQCGRPFTSRRPDAETDSDECKYQDAATNLMRIAGRLGVVEFVDLPEQDQV